MTTRSVPKIIFIIFIICLFSYLVIRSFRYWGLSLFIIVNASIAIIRIRLTFKECYSDLARSSSHLEWFSLSMNIARLFNFLLKYIKYNVLSSCMTAISVRKMGCHIFEDFFVFYFNIYFPKYFHINCFPV